MGSRLRLANLLTGHEDGHDDPPWSEPGAPAHGKESDVGSAAFLPELNRPGFTLEAGRHQ